MNYCYKIVGDFENVDFEDVLQKLSAKFKFMYVDGALFLVLKNWREHEGSKELMDNTLIPAKNFYIQELDKKYVERQQTYIKDWCLTNCIQLDRERYEIEQQIRLQNAWVSMDELEEKLKQIAEDNEKGGKNGE